MYDSDKDGMRKFLEDKLKDLPSPDLKSKLRGKKLPKFEDNGWVVGNKGGVPDVSDFGPEKKKVVVEHLVPKKLDLNRFGAFGGHKSENLMKVEMSSGTVRVLRESPFGKK